ncbi:MAG: DUF5915 domain-containing protein, partial [Gemmatimonadales bacterium]
PAAVNTLRECLIVVSRLLAPATPFVSDWLHRALAGTSVHLADFPVADQADIDADLERAMAGVRRLASLGRSAREAGNRRVRQPLATMRVALPKGVANGRFQSLFELLRQEVNVKQIDVVSSDADLVRLKAKANFRSLGKRFGKRTPEVAALIGRLPGESLRQLEEGQTAQVQLDGAAVDVLPEDVVVEREVTTDWLVQSAGPFVVALDPHLTGDLLAEGIAREVVNRVQRLRKDAGYDYTTRIALGVDGSAAVLDAVRKHADLIQQETLTRSFEVGKVLDPCDARDDASIDDHQAILSVRRLTEQAP